MSSSESLHKQRLHEICGQSVPILQSPQSERSTPYIQFKPQSAVYCPLSGHHFEMPGSVFSMVSSLGFCYFPEKQTSACWTSLFPSSSPHKGVFLASNHLYCLLLSFLQLVTLCFGMGEWHRMQGGRCSLITNGLTSTGYEPLKQPRVLRCSL